MKQKRPTDIQKVMIAFLSLSFVGLLLFSVPEIMGVKNPAVEDTFSEWVWDLSLPIVATISTLFVVIGSVAIWAAGHFLEGWHRRKDDQD